MNKFSFFVLIFLLVASLILSCEKNPPPKPNQTINLDSITFIPTHIDTYFKVDTPPIISPPEPTKYIISTEQLVSLGNLNGVDFNQIIYVYNQDEIVRLSFGYYEIFQAVVNGLYILPNANANYFCYYHPNDELDISVDSVKFVYHDLTEYKLSKQPFVTTPPVFWELNPISKIFIYYSDLQ